MNRALLTGMRLLRMRPMFSAAIVATLAIAIGATTAVFGILDRLLIRPLPFPNPDRIVFVQRAWPLFEQAVHGEPQLAPDGGVAQLARYEVGRVTLGEAEHHVSRVARVGGDFFAILGIVPSAGTVFGRDAAIGDRQTALVLSDPLYRRLFVGEPNPAGRSLTVNGRSYVVSGVMPRDFAFHVRGEPVEAWVPYVDDDNLFSLQQTVGYGAIGRIADGLTLEAAQAKLHQSVGRLAAARPELRLRDTNRPTILSLREYWFGPLRTPLLMLLGAAACLLVIACANVTGLMLARAVARRKDSAIRLTLGGSRGELVQESLGESLLLGLMASGAGLLIAEWGASALIVLSPVAIPHADEIGANWRTAGVALVLGLTAACLSGAMAAWRGSRGNLAGALLAGPRSANRVATRLRYALVVGQIAVTVMLLVNGGLLLRSFHALRFEDTGFDARQVFTMEIAAMGSRFPDAQSRLTYYDRILQVTTATAGVQYAGLVNFLPMHSGSLILPVTLPGVTQDESPSWSYRAATPDYFRAMRLPLLAGRVFTNADRRNAPLVAVVDRSAAAMLGSSPESAIGRRFTVNVGGEAAYEIVGVVGDVRQQGLGIQTHAGFYLSAYQRTPPVVNLVARVTSDPVIAGASLRAALLAVDAALPVRSLELLDTRVSDTVSRRRFAVLLSSVLGLAALALSIVALFGLMSEFVFQRLHEIAVRVAMGARPSHVFGLVLRRAVIFAAIGIGVGLLAATGTTRLVAGLLYGVSVSDPITFFAVPLLVIAAAVVACGVPAVRAVNANPVDALRAE